MNKKLIATLLAAGIVLSVASCNKEEEQTTEAPAVITETEVNGPEKETWEGKWEDPETGEHMEIYELSAAGFKVHFYHEMEGNIELYEYDMEFDNAEQTIASQTGDADSNGGWEYTFILGSGQMTVKDKHSDHIYYRAN